MVCRRRPTRRIINASCYSSTERIPMRLPPPSHSRTKEGQRVSRSLIGGLTRRAVGGASDDPRVSRLRTKLLTTQGSRSQALRTKLKNVGISSPLAVEETSHVPAHRLRRVNDHGGSRGLCHRPGD